MSDRGFERPGSPARPVPEHWPYHSPTPAEQSAGLVLDVASESDPKHSGPPSRRIRLLTAAAIGIIVGAALGAVWVSGTVREPAVPPPIPITVDTFPRELLGAQRNDIPLRRAGFGPTLERLDSEFQEQLSAFRFAYGGDGATFGYGRLLTLTIVNGILPPNLPRDGAVAWNGRASQTRRMISLRTTTLSCTFEPKPVSDPESGIDLLGDFTSDGRTDCVLVDASRDLSLRITHVQVAKGEDAFDSATSFRDELQRIHAGLVD